MTTQTEWELQECLTRLWLRDGVEIDGQLHMLVAWEVMAPSWQINDARGKFDEASIDFLVADKSGRLMAIELKRAVSGIRPAWRVLCQVTHRAVVLCESASPERVAQAHIACMTGDHGRVVSMATQPLRDRHREFYGLADPVVVGAGAFGRVVAALEFGPSWAAILKDFSLLDWPRLRTKLADLGELQQGVARREARRLMALDRSHGGALAGDVRALIVERRHAPGVPNLHWRTRRLVRGRNEVDLE